MIAPINAKEHRKQAPRLHCRNIVESVRRHPGITRQAIARQLGISLSLVNTYTASLLQARWFQVRERLGKAVGRKTESLAVCPGRAAHLCVAVDTGQMHAALFDFAGTVVSERTVGLPDTSTQDAFLSGLTKGLRRILDETRTDRSPRLQLALCLDGAVVQEHAMALSVEGVRAWTPLSLENHLSGRLGTLPYFLSRTTALINHYCIQQRLSDFLLLKLKGALGLGWVKAGADIRGSIGTSGPLSHLSLDPKGPKCICGGRGCLEALVDPMERWRIVEKTLLTDLQKKFHAKCTLVLAGVEKSARNKIEFKEPSMRQVLNGVYHCAAQKTIENGI